MSGIRRLIFPVIFALYTSCISDNTAFMPAQICADEVAQDLVVQPTTTVLRLSEAAADSLDGTPGLVRLFPDAGEFEERHRAAGLHRWFVVDEALGTKATEFVASLDGVELVEEVGEMEVCSAGIPFNDPEAWHQWHLRNDGSLLSGFRKGADINVVPVWENFTAGSREVIVAVLDSGADPTHPDLKDVIVPEGPNGSRNFIKDFSSTPYKLYPERHGTHTSSIIAAANNNAYGCCGIAGGSDGTGGVRILSLQTIADGHSGGNSAEAFVWAADHGAVIASNSWNYAYDTEDKVPSQASASIRTAIDYFIQYAGFDANGKQTGPMAGGVVFFSAGNKSWQHSQPSAYEKVLAVGAIGPDGKDTYYTNYGDYVDICAPGGNYSAFNSNVGEIYGCVPGPGFALLQGTSQACPMVSGVAALIVSQFGGPGFTADKLKDILLKGANARATQNLSKKIGPLVDALGSFTYAGYPVPVCTEFTVTPGDASLMFRWKVQAQGTEAVDSYVCYVGENQEEIEHLDPYDVPESVISVTTSTSGKAIGSTVTRPVYHLAPRGIYYCTMAARSAAGVYSNPAAFAKVRIGENSAPQITLDTEGPFEVPYFGTMTIDCTATDPDGDPLTITTDPGSVAVASWSDLGGGRMRLTIKGDAKRAGYYNARISASDGLEGEASLDIKYTLLPNNAPKRTGIIDRMALLIGGEPVRINLSEYFSDDDGEALRFDAYSSSNMLRTSTDGSYLTISGVDTGISIVTVTATDGANAKISMSFDVLSQESEICLYPIPVTKELNIRSLTPCEGNLTILGPSGNAITSHEFTSAPFAPCVEDMTGLGAGVYKVIIESGGSKMEKTVVKI